MNRTDEKLWAREMLRSFIRDGITLYKDEHIGPVPHDEMVALEKEALRVERFLGIHRSEA